MKKTTIALLVSSFFITTVVNAQDNFVFQYQTTKDLLKPLNLTEEFAKKGAFNLESGSVTLRVRNLSGNGITSLFGVSNSTSDTEYLNFYINRTGNKDTLGIEIRNQKNIIANRQLVTDLPLNSTDFRTITYTFDKANSQINIYVNGTKVHSLNNSKFFADIANLNTAYLGKTNRSSQSPWRATADIYYADLDTNVLTDAEVQAKHQRIENEHLDDLEYDDYKREALGAYQSEKFPLFVSGQEGARNYRIPALITTQNNVVIAAIDKRHQHSSDWGNIDTSIRRSFDGGKTWERDQVVIDLVKQSYGSENSAFLIDPLMVQDKKSGRVFMLVDMFPETKGFFGINQNNSSEGSGYKRINGKSYRLLTDSENNQYTVRENGVVYNESNQPTEYRVVVEGNPKISFRDLGDLYRGSQRLGNVFLQTSQANNDTAPLKTKITSYLWMTYSDDDGATWSSPVDITSQVKADWMRFLGTGPGNGIQLKDGTLVMPIYYTNSNNKQSSAVIISKDGGKTWERGESPNDRLLHDSGGSRYLSNGNHEITESQIIELDNGQLKMFSRNTNGLVRISTSKDGGYTWQNKSDFNEELLDPYSQLSVIKYSKRINGKEYIIFANPHSSTRHRLNGKIIMGEVQEDGSIDWKYSTTIAAGSYAYNSLTELPNGDIGLLYEESANKINYVSLNLQDLLWKDNILHRDARNTPFQFELNSWEEETFYKIGDGEIIKVGEGVNLASLEVNEGTVALNQTADTQGKQEAFKSVLVNQAGTLRLDNATPMNFSNITLNQGTLNLNGQSVTLAEQNAENIGLRANQINGNIINDNAQTPANLTYALSGERALSGKLGNDKGKLNLIYAPENDGSNLTLKGNSVINVIDVQNGSVTYAAETAHQANEAKIGTNAKLVLQNGTTANIKNLDLAEGAQALIHNDSDKITTLNTDSITGKGDIIKTGSGLLILSGDIQNSGKTDIQQGTLELNGTLNGNLNISAGSKLTGSGQVSGNSVWKAGSRIAPQTTSGNRSRSSSFTPETLRFASVTAEDGTSVDLRIGNHNNDVGSWSSDKLLISGDITTNSPNMYIPVNLKLLESGSDKAGATDTNNNGKYDADEGISLIQVGGKSRLGLFKAANEVTVGGSPYKYTLVAIDKGDSVAAENQVGTVGNDYYDYRLQAVLQTPDGISLEPIVTTAEEKRKTAEEAEKARLAAEKAAAEKTAAEQAASEAAEKAATEQATRKAAAEQARLEAEKTAAEQAARVAAEKAAVEQLTQERAEKSTVEKITKAEAEKASVQQSARIAEEKAAVEQATHKEAEKHLAEQLPNPQTRAKLDEQIPSYLVSGTAMTASGEKVRNLFTTQFDQQADGFYLIQDHTHSKYTSNLGFAEYGYGYKTKQNTTAFGANSDVTDNTSLNAMVSFTTANIEPKEDKAHKTRYKSTGALLGMKHKLDNLSVTVGVGYHLHRGKVSDGNRVKGKQYQVFSTLGYDIPLSTSLIFTPTVGLGYQNLENNINDSRLKVTSDDHRVFNQVAGAKLTYKTSAFDVKFSVAYENNIENNHYVQVGQERFKTGKLGNALITGLAVESNITPNLSFGLQANHRAGVSSAKRTETGIGAKVEYKF